MCPRFGTQFSSRCGPFCAPVVANVFESGKTPQVNFVASSASSSLIEKREARQIVIAAVRREKWTRIFGRCCKKRALASCYFPICAVSSLCYLPFCAVLSHFYFPIYAARCLKLVDDQGFWYFGSQMGSIALSPWASFPCFSRR